MVLSVQAAVWLRGGFSIILRICKQTGFQAFEQTRPSTGGLEMPCITAR
jgi:hypothetical protein